MNNFVVDKTLDLEEAITETLWAGLAFIVFPGGTGGIEISGEGYERTPVRFTSKYRYRWYLASGRPELTIEDVDLGGKVPPGDPWRARTSDQVGFTFPPGGVGPITGVGLFTNPVGAEAVHLLACPTSLVWLGIGGSSITLGYLVVSGSVSSPAAEIPDDTRHALRDLGVLRPELALN